MGTSTHQWRVLAVFCHPKSETAKGNGPIDELLGSPMPHLEVLVLRNKSLQEVGEQILVWQPNIVYFTGGIGGPEELAMLFQGVMIDTVYFDAPGCSRQADLIRSMGVENVVFWAIQAPQAPHAAQFSRAFFASLRDPSAPTLEAFAVATQTTQAHCTTPTNGEHQAPPAMPQLLSESAPSLPDMDTIPPPDVPGAHIITGCMAGIAGWDSIRLLAPQAELRLLLSGQPSLIDQKRLGALGLGLRAFLAKEMRCLSLVSSEPCAKVPAHLPPGSAAVRCSVRTSGGTTVNVVLGGHAEVLQRQEVVQLALRHTLTADSLSLQMRLPPAGAPPPPAKSAAHVACANWVVEAVAVTSVWAVNVLRSLCQDTSYRGLVAMGVAAVGGSPVAAFSQADAAHYAPFAAEAAGKPPTGKKTHHSGGGSGFAAMRGGTPLQDGSSYQEGSYEHSGSGGWGLDDEEEGAKKRGRKRQKSRLAPEEDVEYIEGKEPYKRQNIPYHSQRPPIRECSEAQFMRDYCAFCSSQMGRRVTPDSWPDTVLNGIRLDVYNLYREVVQRGGFGMGNGINWKGQIFPKMQNFTPTHKMTGIGNALKTKYQQLLLDYERAHPQDVTSDRCAICGGGEEVATDWVSCDSCDTWVHFSCDERPGLGPFKEYAKTDGLSYICADCAT